MIKIKIILLIFFGNILSEISQEILTAENNELNLNNIIGQDTAIIKIKAIIDEVKEKNLINKKIEKENYLNIKSNLLNLEKEHENSFILDKKESDEFNKKCKERKKNYLFAMQRANENCKKNIKNLNEYEKFLYKKSNFYGIMLHGSSGNGKTFIPKAIAGELKADLYSINTSLLESSFIGEGQKKLINFFNNIKINNNNNNNNNKVIFFDEFDSIFKNKKNNGRFSETDNARKQLITSFLIEIEKLKNEDIPFVLIASSGFYNEIDKIVAKKLEHHIEIKIPDSKEKRIEILNKFLKIEEINYFKKSIIEKIAIKTVGFSILDLKNYTSNLILYLKKNNINEITEDIIDKIFINSYIKSKNEILLNKKIKENIEDIVLNEKSKKALLEIIKIMDFYQDEAKIDFLKKNNIKYPKGIIFHGPPGTGKTFYAKKIAENTESKFFYKSASDFYKKDEIEDFFNEVKNKSSIEKPSIVFIDEIDSLAKDRNLILNELLIQLDGFDDNLNNPFIIIVATNNLDSLDKAFVRTGRFDKKIEFFIPDINEKIKIINYILKNEGLDKEIFNEKVIDFIAKNSFDFSQSDLNLILKELNIEKIIHNQNLTFDFLLEKIKNFRRDNKLYKNEKEDNYISNFKPIKNTNFKFSDVAGNENAKNEILHFIDYLKNPEKYKNFGIAVEKGILLMGPSGTGKTLLAKALAGEAGIPFFEVNGSDFVKMYVGTGSINVKNLFKEARGNSPCIIFIDEADALLTRRSFGEGNSESDKALNQFLVELDGFKENNFPILVICATNAPIETLDEAALRPGRIGKHIKCYLPLLKDRIEIVKIHSKNKILDSKLTPEYIAKKTPDFSGAQICELLNISAMLAFEKNKDKIYIEDIHEAFEKMICGNKMLNAVVSDKSYYETAIHELGHTFCMLFNKNYTNVFDSVSILPRDGGSLGVTYSVPEKEDFGGSKNKEELMADIICSYGGMVAESLFLKTTTNGVSSDLRNVKNIANRMVIHYGMKGAELVGRELSDKDVQVAVKEILDECYKKAEEIIKSKKDLMNIMVEELVKKKVLYADDIKEICEISKIII